MLFDGPAAPDRPAPRSARVDQDGQAIIQDRQPITTSIGDCSESGTPEDICSTQFAAAARQWTESAPRFDSIDACEQEFGAGHCMPGDQPVPAVPVADQPASTTARVVPVYMPMMYGWYWNPILQSAVAVPPSRDDRQPRYAYSGGSGAGAAFYSSRTSSSPIGYGGRTGSAGSAATATARGGLGATGSAHGGGGE